MRFHNMLGRRPAVRGLMRSNLILGSGVGGPPPVAGSSATTFATTPSIHYHMPTATVATSGGRFTSITDRQGLANASEGSTGVGALDHSDLLGRRCMRLNGSEYMNIADGLVADQRGIAVFMVMRHHRQNGGTQSFFGQGRANGTTYNTGFGTINSSSSTSLASHVRGHSISGNTAASGTKEKLILGSQVQVAGVVSRPTASGGQRIYVNNIAANVAQSTASNTGAVGAEIGRYPFSPGSSGAWAMADIYELVVFVGVLSDAEADAIAAALVANWAIEQPVNRLVLEGDSITQGVTAVVSGSSLSMVLTEPGAAWAAPASWHVHNAGVSGNQISNLVTRRDATNSWPNFLLSGINRVAIQIGRNDFATGGLTAQQTYDALVPLIHTTTTGYLERGWDVRQTLNIANGSLEATYDAYRTLLRAAQFKTDTLTNTGQTYDGKLAVIDLTAITDGGATPFDLPADASNTTYYQETTHPNIYGTKIMGNGGDSTANGYAATFA